jgi:hypothetical protein
MADPLALERDECAPSSWATHPTKESTMLHEPFARALARRVPDWTLRNGSTTPLPTGDFAAGEAIEQVELIPYGATNLRIGEFPTLSK